jgi:hypothetical protein
VTLAQIYSNFFTHRNSINTISTNESAALSYLIIVSLSKSADPIRKMTSPNPSWSSSWVPLFSSLHRLMTTYFVFSKKMVSLLNLFILLSCSTWCSSNSQTVTTCATAAGASTDTISVSAGGEIEQEVILNEENAESVHKFRSLGYTPIGQKAAEFNPPIRVDYTSNVPDTSTGSETTLDGMDDQEFMQGCMWTFRQMAHICKNDGSVKV